MTDFIREVDEDLRQERFKRALDRYWYVIAAVVVLVLAGVGAWKAWDYLRTQKAEQASGQYLAALDLARDGKTDDALAGFRAVEAEGTPGYKLLARIRLAGETGIKDPEAGARQFDAIAADPSVEPALQAVTRLRSALLLVDKLPFDAFKAKIDPLTDANSPVRNTARELLALAALKAGKTEDAGRALDAIASDPLASGAQRQRVQALLGLVVSAGKAPEPAVATTPAATAPAITAPAVPLPAPAAPAAATSQAPAEAAPATPSTPAPAADTQPVSAGPNATVPAPSSPPPAPAPALTPSAAPSDGAPAAPLAPAPTADTQPAPPGPNTTVPAAPAPASPGDGSPK